MVLTKIGAILSIPATIAAIVGSVLAFNKSYVTKDSFDYKVQKVEVQLAGALKDFRDDFNNERQLRREENFRIRIQQLQSQQEFYEDKVRELDHSSKKNSYERNYYKRQLERIRNQNEKMQDALIEIQKNK